MQDASKNGQLYLAAIRVRAASRQAIAEAADALASAARRLEKTNQAMQLRGQTDPDLVRVARNQIGDLATCRSNVARLRNFRSVLEARESRIEELVRIPEDLVEILFPYLPDALTPLLREMDRQGDGEMTPETLTRVLWRAEGDNARVCV